MINKICILVLVCTSAISCSAQKIDSIYFNLYTDSLKKGTFNYINVDGKFSDGRWQPLTDKQLTFSSSSGTFEGNSLFIDKNFNEEKVMITAALKTDKSVSKSITIYIKKKEDDEKLKTNEEIIREIEQQRRKKQKLDI